MAEKRRMDHGFSAWSYRIFVWGGGVLMLAYLVAPILTALFDPAESAPLHLAALNSLKVAGAAVVVVTLIAAPAALAMARAPRRVVTAVEPMLLAPLVLPALVYSLSALLALSLLGLGTSFWTVLIGHAIVFAPLMFRTVLGLAQRQSISLEEASAMLGASRSRTFLKVSLPGILPGIFAGAFLVFMQSLDNVDVTLFLGNPGEAMLPMRLFAMLQESLDGRVAAVSGVLILAAALLLITLEWLNRRGPR